MDGESYSCKFCGESLTAGDAEWSNTHFLNRHVADYIDGLERGGATESEAHRKANGLVHALGTPAG